MGSIEEAGGKGVGIVLVDCLAGTGGVLVELLSGTILGDLEGVLGVAVTVSPLPVGLVPGAAVAKLKFLRPSKAVSG